MGPKITANTRPIFRQTTENIPIQEVFVINLLHNRCQISARNCEWMCSATDTRFFDCS